MILPNEQGMSVLQILDMMIHTNPKCRYLSRSQRFFHCKNWIVLFFFRCWTGGHDKYKRFARKVDEHEMWRGWTRGDWEWGSQPSSLPPDGGWRLFRDHPHRTGWLPGQGPRTAHNAGENRQNPTGKGALSGDTEGWRTLVTPQDAVS